MPISSTDYYLLTRALFKQNTDEATAQWMQNYMRHQFIFYGIKTPLRRTIQKQIIAEYGYPTIEQLPELMNLFWADEHRDFQLFGVDLMAKLIKKTDKSFISVVEKLIVTKSWWDTVDFLASKLVGNLGLRFPELIPNYPNRWIVSDNIWLQRTAILFQLKYKQQTNTDLLFQYIMQLKDSDEFFIQKAAGWALREYSKTDWALVLNFIENNNLAPLTQREGLKWMKAKG
ncbi:MAG: DNA alkylation repair protein [Bacteroidota bacterium]